MGKKDRTRVLPACFMLIALTGFFAEAYAEEDEFEMMDLESLVEVETTELISISKRSQSKFTSPSAAYVLSSEDILRSGYTTVPEVLRLIPGLHVARLGAASWSVASRGLGGEFLNRLLVMVDGRSIYNPLLSVVYWDIGSIPLEEVERIEMIRGPGAVLWGVNASNGIINIVLKNSKSTIGNQLALGGGSLDKSSAFIRSGWRLSKHDSARIYAAHYVRDALEEEGLGEPNGNWTSGQAGFRYDHNGDTDVITLSGDFSFSDQRRITNGVDSDGFFALLENDVNAIAANVLGRWSYRPSLTSDRTLQVYYDRQKRDYNDTQISVDTFDLDFQQHWKVGSHDLVVGGGGRLVYDDVEENPILRVDLETENLHQAGIFVQDTWSLSDKVDLTFGTKLSYNDFTNTDVLPGIRLGWKASESSFFWLASSKSIRLPSRYERSNEGLVGGVPEEFVGVLEATRLIGARSAKGDKLMAYEAGVRKKLSEATTANLSLYYNDYSRITTASFSGTSNDPAIRSGFPVLDFQINSLSTAVTYGGELSIESDLFRWWQLTASYSYFRMSKNVPVDSALVGDESPEHIGVLFSKMELIEDIHLDTIFRYVSTVPGIETAVGETYRQIDVRIGWSISDDTELSLVGQNLLGRQEEFVNQADGLGQLQTEPSVYVLMRTSLW